ncbi:uncharacterized protein LOC111124108 isoform X2 [Crassostrea virginica]
MLGVGCLQCFFSLFILLFIQNAEGYYLTQGNSLYRSCSSGYFLQITYARYYHSACTNQADVTSRINSMCNYPSACTIYADNSWLGGNPCSGYTKTLEWTDFCNAIWSGWSAWTSCPGDCGSENLTRQRTCLKPNGACGTVPSQSVSCERFGCYSASDISRSTPNDHIWYNLTTNDLVATGRTYLRFRARANNDVNIALTSHDSVTSGTAYDIVIGGGGNTRSTLRYGIEGSECVHTNHNPLSQTFFDEFWVSWTGSYVRVGTGTSVGSSYFLSCYQPSMYSINFIWIRTGWGSSGEWRFVSVKLCPSSLENAVLSSNCLRRPGDSCSFSCIQGYLSSTLDQLMCTSEGVWNNATTKLCSKITREQNNEEVNTESKTSLYVGGSVGGLLVIFIIVVAIIVLLKRRNSGRESGGMPLDNIYTLSKGHDPNLEHEYCTLRF